MPRFDTPSGGGGTGIASGVGRPWLYTVTAPPLAATWTLRGGAATLTDVAGGGLLVNSGPAATVGTYWTRPLPTPGATGWRVELGSLIPWTANAGGFNAVSIGIADAANMFSAVVGGSYTYSHALFVMATGAYLGNGGYASLAGESTGSQFATFRQDTVGPTWYSGRMEGPGPTGTVVQYNTAMVLPFGLGAAATQLGLRVAQTGDSNFGNLAFLAHYREVAI